MLVGAEPPTEDALGQDLNATDEGGRQGSDAEPRGQLLSLLVTGG